eukprot:4633103-Amphidinium_carterae.1
MAEKRVLNKLESYGQVPAASVHDDHPKFIGPNTCRAKGNAVLMSLQTLFVFLISVNVLWLAVEVDVPESSSWYDTVTLVSYILTVTFFLEAVLNMISMCYRLRLGDIGTCWSTWRRLEVAVSAEVLAHRALCMEASQEKCWEAIARPYDCSKWLHVDFRLGCSDARAELLCACVNCEECSK